MRFLPRMSLALLSVAALAITAFADEPVTLIGTIVKWRYPDAEIGKSQMSDAATIDADGKRTAPSTILETTMTTADSVDKVLKYLKALIERSQTNWVSSNGQRCFFWILIGRSSSHLQNFALFPLRHCQTVRTGK